MRNLSGRIAQLERGTQQLSAWAKAWLGWPLTEVEREALHDPPGDFDATGLSMEARQWLGID